MKRALETWLLDGLVALTGLLALASPAIAFVGVYLAVTWIAGLLGMP